MKKNYKKMWDGLKKYYKEYSHSGSDNKRCSDSVKLMNEMEDFYKYIKDFSRPGLDIYDSHGNIKIKDKINNEIDCPVCGGRVHFRKNGI